MCQPRRDAAANAAGWLFEHSPAHRIGEGSLNRREICSVYRDADFEQMASLLALTRERGLQLIFAGCDTPRGFRRMRHVVERPFCAKIIAFAQNN
jgi:hypothetical protein